MKTRFGVVGTGYWAEQVHLPVLRAAPGIELVGIWGRSPQTTRAVAGRFGIAAFDSFEALLGQVDALSFVVPPDIQARLGTMAARAGKHLLLEKPLALALADAEALAAAVADNRVASAVFFTRRFTDDVERQLHSLAAGQWTAASAHLHAGALRPGTPYSESAWRHEHGALWDIGPHILSVLLPVMGPVASVLATQDAQRVTRLDLTHASGARSTASMSLHADPADFGEGYAFTGAGGVTRLDVPPAPRLEAFGNAAAQLVGEIASGARGGHCDAAFALGVGRILSAAQTSLGSGAAVRPGG